jgi:pyruvate/2-oxoglutarate dehydrogenase complex dihydrolipoamide dehydrogenase (E3) component/uncharacterized membrane protein YdjX (TVP38/TMEM64 family)
MKSGKLIVFGAVVVVIAVFFYFDLGQHLNLEYLQSQQSRFEAYQQAHPLRALTYYFCIYVAVAALSLPGAALTTLIGGAIFGLMWGTIVVSFASVIGATLAFLVSRFLFRDAVQKRFAYSLKSVDEGIEKDGAFYLFFLRLVPGFPFLVVNLVMGLTSMQIFKYVVVSQIGMLPGTIVFVNAGTQLGQIESLGGILSPSLIGSFVLLGVFPFIAKRIMDSIKARRVFKPYTRPRRFDNDIVVIGAGSAGLVTSYIAAAVKAKVTLIERNKMGGDCLNTGCVPSKALIRSAKFLKHAKRAHEFGMRSAEVQFEFSEVMERIQRVIHEIEPHDSVERYTQLGVNCIEGEAQIVSPFEVRVNDQVLTTRNIVIATGSRPFVPPIPGLDQVGYLTSDTVWDLRVQPARLVVLGGGPIGSELAQAFARLGTKVMQVEMLPRILTREDVEVSHAVRASLEEDGVSVLVNHRAKSFHLADGQRVLVCEHDGHEVRLEFDEVLVAVGRAANVTGFGLERLGVSVKKTIDVNEYLETTFPNIFACGDVAGPYQFTHVSAHQAWFASVNALFGSLKKFKVDYSVIPWATFTEPEVARVGLNELEANEQGIAYEVTVYGLDDLDRAIADSEAHGFVKVLTVPGKDRILGVTIMGEHAGDLIAEFVTAMRYKLGLNKVLGTIHIYPTFGEANKYVAGEWKRAHAPEHILGWLEKYHAWRRG